MAVAFRTTLVNQPALKPDVRKLCDRAVFSHCRMQLMVRKMVENTQD